MSSDEICDLDTLKADIASRLRSACGHFPASEFEELVTQIAQIELKYARWGAESAPQPAR